MVVWDGMKVPAFWCNGKHESSGRSSQVFARASLAECNIATAFRIDEVRLGKWKKPAVLLAHTAPWHAQVAICYYSNR